MRKILGLKLILFTAVITGIGWLALSYFQPGFSFKLFVTVPLFLGLIESGVILFINKYLQNNGEGAERYVFINKLIKVALSLAFILIVYMRLGLDKTFVIVFVIYYFAYIAFESWLFIRCNRELIQKTE
ncbi:hypothetical protein [Bacteroides propionicifaciens]|uniref:hypothetical protein n=1 Tax=Bacteroides propionicifaciens TaxID=392838 RepID=UPI000367CC9D|nr:hypothetical protein [Bacteroides propionicifaciens]